jgi:hypothetical protein
MRAVAVMFDFVAEYTFFLPFVCLNQPPRPVCKPAAILSSKWPSKRFPAQRIRCNWRNKRTGKDKYLCNQER